MWRKSLIAIWRKQGQDQAWPITRLSRVAATISFETEVKSLTFSVACRIMWPTSVQIIWGSYTKRQKLYACILNLWLIVCTVARVFVCRSPCAVVWRKASAKSLE